MKHGITTAYYLREQVTAGGRTRDVRIALGSEYDGLEDRAKAAREKIDALRNPPAPEPPPPPAPPAFTVTRAVVWWLKGYATTKRKPRGVSQARKRFKTYLLPSLGGMALEDLTADDLTRLLAKLQTDKVGLMTRRRLMEDVRCLLGVAVDRRKLASNPWRRDLLPKFQKPAPKPLIAFELAEVLRVAPERWKPVLALLAHSGLRWGELHGLRWEDVQEATRWEGDELVRYRFLLVERSYKGPTKCRRSPRSDEI